MCTTHPRISAIFEDGSRVLCRCTLLFCSLFQFPLEKQSFHPVPVCIWWEMCPLKVIYLFDGLQLLLNLLQNFQNIWHKKLMPYCCRVFRLFMIWKKSMEDSAAIYRWQKGICKILWTLVLKYTESLLNSDLLYIVCYLYFDKETRELFINLCVHNSKWTR